MNGTEGHGQQLHPERHGQNGVAGEGVGLGEAGRYSWVLAAEVAEDKCDEREAGEQEASEHAVYPAAGESYAAGVSRGPLGGRTVGDDGVDVNGYVTIRLQLFQIPWQ